MVKVDNEAMEGGTKMNDTIVWQRLEGGLIFVGGVAFVLGAGSGLSWWAALLIFLAPDLTFISYVLGPKGGAFGYNLAHLYAVGALVMLAGFFMAAPLVAAIGALLLAHVGFDRMMGYGLKSREGFGITHLGLMGKARR